MTTPEPGRINQTIIVIDHDPIYLAMIQDFLSEEGHTRVLCVPSDRAEETIRREQPSLGLLDIHAAWPASGVQLLDRLRRDPLTAALPVIICTTNAHLVAARLTHELMCGCQILEKPFQLEELLTRVQTSIGLPKRLPHAQP